ncbi:hypothetical protein CEXT_755971 [Caerostris extrusa]|uniref:Uncharacterized protein n=1 Tax=Caerostris extrusa TaxID=172846 RepID=A0AAV4R156_CAEEX|nr:hypothetical protein CEXT_755971 [Caerostris extrusa]
MSSENTPPHARWCISNHEAHIYEVRPSIVSKQATLHIPAVADPSSNHRGRHDGRPHLDSAENVHVCDENELSSNCFERPQPRRNIRFKPSPPGPLSCEKSPPPLSHGTSLDGVLRRIREERNSPSAGIDPREMGSWGGKEKGSFGVEAVFSFHGEILCQVSAFLQVLRMSFDTFIKIRTGSATEISDFCHCADSTSDVSQTNCEPKVLVGVPLPNHGRSPFSPQGLLSEQLLILDTRISDSKELLKAAAGSADDVGSTRDRSSLSTGPGASGCAQMGRILRCPHQRQDVLERNPE